MAQNEEQKLQQDIGVSKVFTLVEPIDTPNGEVSVLTVRRVKIKDYNNIFILLNIVGLVFMYGTHSMYNIMSEKRLWGFWVCLIWSATMIIYDFIILLKIRKERQTTNA